MDLFLARVVADVPVVVVLLAVFSDVSRRIDRLGDKLERHLEASHYAEKDDN